MNAAFGVFGSLLGAIVGAYAVYYFAVRQFALKRRAEFREKQLSEFYSPVGAIAQNLRLRHDIANEILGARDRLTTDVVKNSPASVSGSEHTQRVIENAHDLLRYTRYDLERWRSDLLPQYRRLVELFSERYWLADEDTRSFYPALLRFLEIYDRLDKGSMSQEVADQLGHATNSQRPLFEHVEAKVEHLRRELLAPQ